MLRDNLITGHHGCTNTYIAKIISIALISSKQKTLKVNKSLKNNILYWWDRAELNRRHTDFQSVALPTELQSQTKGWQIYTL